MASDATFAMATPLPLSDTGMNQEASSSSAVLPESLTVDAISLDYSSSFGFNVQAENTYQSGESRTRSIGESTTIVTMFVPVTSSSIALLPASSTSFNTAMETSLQMSASQAGSQSVDEDNSNGSAFSSTAGQLPSTASYLILTDAAGRAEETILLSTIPYSTTIESNFPDASPVAFGAGSIYTSSSIIEEPGLLPTLTTQSFDPTVVAAFDADHSSQQSETSDLSTDFALSPASLDSNSASDVSSTTSLAWSNLISGATTAETDDILIAQETATATFGSLSFMPSSDLASFSTYSTQQPESDVYADGATTVMTSASQTLTSEPADHSSGSGIEFELSSLTFSGITVPPVSMMPYRTSEQSELSLSTTSSPSSSTAAGQQESSVNSVDPTFPTSSSAWQTVSSDLSDTDLSTDGGPWSGVVQLSSLSFVPSTTVSGPVFMLITSTIIDDEPISTSTSQNDFLPTLEQTSLSAIPTTVDYTPLSYMGSAMGESYVMDEARPTLSTFVMPSYLFSDSAPTESMIGMSAASTALPLSATIDSSLQEEIMTSSTTIEFSISTTGSSVVDTQPASLTALAADLDESAIESSSTSFGVSSTLVGSLLLDSTETPTSSTSFDVSSTPVSILALDSTETPTSSTSFGVSSTPVSILALDSTETPTSSTSFDVSSTPVGSLSLDSSETPTSSTSSDISSTPVNSLSLDLTETPTSSTSFDVSSTPVGSLSLNSSEIPTSSANEKDATSVFAADTFATTVSQKTVFVISSTSEASPMSSFGASQAADNHVASTGYLLSTSSDSTTGIESVASKTSTITLSNGYTIAASEAQIVPSSTEADPSSTTITETHQKLQASLAQATYFSTWSSTLRSTTKETTAHATMSAALPIQTLQLQNTYLAPGNSTTSDEITLTDGTVKNRAGLILVNRVNTVSRFYTFTWVTASQLATDPEAYVVGLSSFDTTTSTMGVTGYTTISCLEDGQLIYGITSEPKPVCPNMAIVSIRAIPTLDSVLSDQSNLLGSSSVESTFIVAPDRTLSFTDTSKYSRSESAISNFDALPKTNSLIIDEIPATTTITYRDSLPSGLSQESNAPMTTSLPGFAASYIPASDDYMSQTYSSVVLLTTAIADTTQDPSSTRVTFVTASSTSLNSSPAESIAKSSKRSSTSSQMFNMDSSIHTGAPSAIVSQSSGRYWNVTLPSSGTAVSSTSDFPRQVSTTQATSLGVESSAGILPNQFISSRHDTTASVMTSRPDISVLPSSSTISALGARSSSARGANIDGVGSDVSSTHLDIDSTTRTTSLPTSTTRVLPTPFVTETETEMNTKVQSKSQSDQRAPIIATVVTTTVNVSSKTGVPAMTVPSKSPDTTNQTSVDGSNDDPADQETKNTAGMTTGGGISAQNAEATADPLSVATVPDNKDAPAAAASIQHDSQDTNGSTPVGTAADSGIEGVPADTEDENYEDPSIEATGSAQTGGPQVSTSSLPQSEDNHHVQSDQNSLPPLSNITSSRPADKVTGSTNTQTATGSLVVITSGFSTSQTSVNLAPSVPVPTSDRQSASALPSVGRATLPVGSGGTRSIHWASLTMACFVPILFL
ncbi:protein of unknown function [Taphrina deformans PYCC 5710]|uniref:Uncharacterized protein n=1 Tax=Taphrina deformans (strain PYCC 5710 / ATCC 11124 / CBS 356.35 / IMI 108563 / JCM 9778 / NBRC 8474) TaxID=1097556 RepID=R4XFB9_TAPDE|nr:protein of unknown function [Taphrina deformans PYCC 5710]|eukprot:CCG84567.1 protein of unknown function [Taphrina deformans PYCC 5710]